MTDETTRHNQAVYDGIAARYAGRHTGGGQWFSDLRRAFTARLPPAASVADLGCGPAQEGGLFAAAGYQVIGVDRSAGMLAIAAASLPGRVLQGDLRCLPLASASLDGIWCCAALLHVPAEDTAAALAELRRVLLDHGQLALVTAAGEGTALEPVSYAPGEQRWFFYRQPDRLRRQLRTAGFQVTHVSEERTSRHWLKILATAAPG